MPGGVEPVVAMVKMEKQSGLHDWPLNEAVDLTGPARDGHCLIKKLPEAVFDLYNVNGSALVFGKGKKISDYWLWRYGTSFT